MKYSIRKAKSKIKFKRQKKAYKKKKPKSQKQLKKIILIIIFSIILFFIEITKKPASNETSKLELNIKKYINPSKTSKTKVAMCTIAKKENRYIKYFVEFYMKLGYDHIYFYDNNEIGDEAIDDLPIVKEGIKEGFISIISYRNKTGNFVTQSYYDCYEEFYLQYDWISFFDIDEYLILEPKNISIQEFLDNPRFNNCELIQFNWRVFTDNDQLDYEDKPLMERFPIETNYKYENRHVKSTIRGSLDYKKLRRNGSPHSVYSNIKACSPSGKVNGWGYYSWPPDFEYAALHHYVTKSIREFFYKKFKTKVDVDKIGEWFKRYLFDYFFKVNRKAKEKVDIFNEIYHTNYQ